MDTDSNGVVYVFWDGFEKRSRMLAIFYIRSFDGGQSFERPARLLTTVVSPGNTGTMDGAAGARDGLTSSISIANGAPSGEDAAEYDRRRLRRGPDGRGDREGLVRSAVGDCARRLGRRSRSLRTEAMCPHL